MNIFKQYRDYLKNNPEGYWFKRKLYGWGWTPARPQGWLITLLYIVFIVMLFLRVQNHSESGNDTLVGMLIPFLIVTMLFLTVCFVKGEKPKWQWGEKDKNKDNFN